MNSREIQAAVRQAENLRVSDQDNVFDARLIQSFIHHVLEHPATREPLEELLLEHVATGRDNPSDITEREKNEAIIDSGTVRCHPRCIFGTD